MVAAPATTAAAIILFSFMFFLLITNVITVARANPRRLTWVKL
jgi:hypothetical protein